MSFTISGTWTILFFSVKTRTNYLWNFGYERERKLVRWLLQCCLKKYFLSDFGDDANTFCTLTSCALVCFLHFLGTLGICDGVKTLVQRGMPHWVGEAGFAQRWEIQGEGSRGFADSSSRWTRDSVQNPLRERTCVSRFLAVFRGVFRSGKNRREGVISPEGQEGPWFWEGLRAGSKSRWITGCGWDWDLSAGRSEGRGTVMKGVQGTWVLGGWGPEVYQICRPRGSLRAGISSNSPSTYYRILFLFSLLFFRHWSL